MRSANAIAAESRLINISFAVHYVMIADIAPSARFRVIAVDALYNRFFIDAIAVASTAFWRTACVVDYDSFNRRVIRNSVIAVRIVIGS